MARPRNEELFATIRQAAYRQLLARGYTDTTYQSIASECGVARTAVQTYFPTKSELTMAFSRDLLSAIHRIVLDSGLHQENEFDFMFCIGQSLFGFLMQDERSRKYLRESVSSRDLTEETLDFEYRWGISFLSTPLAVPEETFHEDVLVSMGGFYTLLYRRLKDGLPFDIATHLGRVVRTIMVDYGYVYDEAESFVATHRMSEDELGFVIAKLAEEMEL